jgi:hypothetical protein
MAKALEHATVIGVTSEHNPTLHLWLLSLFIMTASVAALFLVASIFVLNIPAGLGFLVATGLSLWAIKAVIDRMKWY